MHRRINRALALTLLAVLWQRKEVLSADVDEHLRTDNVRLRKEITLLEYEIKDLNTIVSLAQHIKAKAEQENTVLRVAMSQLKAENEEMKAEVERLKGL